jgi:hypothetical protein
MVSERGSDRGPLLGGLGLLAAYAVVSVVFDGFALPTGVDYVALREALGAAGVDERLVRDLAPHAAASALAKLLLLAPATALLAWPVARRWPRRWRDRPLPATGGAVAGIVVVCAALLVVWSQLVLQGQPLFDDEFTYRFQAQTLAAGWLAAPAPPCPACFENVFIILRDGLWAGKYTSGHPALLALSSPLGSPYVVTIVLGALAPWLVWLVGREVAGPSTAFLAAAALLISPFFVITASTLMNHATCLVFLAVFTLGYLRARRGAGWAWALAAGLALGVAFNIRPQSAVAVGLPFGVWTLARLRGGGRPVLREGLLVLAGLAPLLVWAGYYNHAVSGAWYRFPFMMLEDAAPSAVALLAPAGQGEPDHTLWKGLFYGLLNVWRLNLHLFGWGVSLIFVAVALRRGPRDAHDRVWLGVAATILAIHAGFPSPGVLEVGPRYLFPLLIPLALWTARGVREAHAWAASGGRPRALVPAFVALSVVLAVVTFGREQARHLHAVTDAVARPYRALAAADLEDAIVLVRAKPPSGWVFGLRNNHPRLATNDPIVIKLTDLGSVFSLLDAFPDREVSVLSFDPERPAAEPELVPFTREQLRQRRRASR